MPNPVAFPFAPDWSAPVQERVEYLSSLYVARSGKEQRARLRNIPRRGLAFRVSTATAQQALGSLIWSRQGETLGVPWWPDAVRFSGTLSQGATTIAITTTNRLFAMASMVMVWESPNKCEIQAVESVSSSLVTCSALSRAYTDPLILPVFAGRMEPSQRIRRDTARLAVADVRFACEVMAGDPRPNPPTPTQAYGFEVLPIRPDWQSPEQRADRILSRFDPGMGPIYIRDRADLSFQSQAFPWFLNGRASVQAFRDFMDRRAGRVTPFWAPTWRDDLTIVQDANSGSSGILIAECGYTSRMFPARARRYLAIRAGDSLILRKVLSASSGEGGETLGLDAPHGVALPAGTPVSFLVLCRLDSDATEIDWSTTTFGQAETRFVEIPHEVPA